MALFQKIGRSGNAAYLPKFTDVRIIAISSMQEDANGHVGIGGPADNYYKLRIAGDVYVNDSDSGNGIVLASQLNNRPLISRQMNQFTTGPNAPWIGRWLFMEQTSCY